MSQVVFYEAQGKLHIAVVMEQKDSHLQVKGQGSSTQKIKSKNVLLQANLSDTPANLTTQVEAISAEVDLDFLWECAPETVFGFVEIAREYYGETASIAEQAAMWQAIQGAPIYFGKKGKGQFTRQPREQIDIALAAVAKKEERLRQQAVWVEQMIAGQAPAEILQARDAILQKKNANDMTYKAALEASSALGKTLPELMLHIGAFKNAFELHRAVFLAEYYPKGTQAHELSVPTAQHWQTLLDEGIVSDSVLDDRPVFSIDDSQTTEIDDAFSLKQIDAQNYRIGVHIAAPSLAVVRDDAADTHAASRMSTLYTPGEKVTMLPDSWVAEFSLDAGSVKSVFSIYTTFNTDGSGQEAFTEIQTKIERVKITDNLRHDTPQLQLTAADLDGARTDYPRAIELKILWQAAQQLSTIRDAVRGRPENNNRADFNFAIDNLTNNALTGEEFVTISQRMRGSPIDKIVSEWMIFANVNWASQLRDLRVPALFRTQSTMGVRTTTYAAPHLAMGVPAYMWATSPLRRYADWLNQMQLLAVVRYGVTAPMKAPFQPKEVDLLTRVSQFDERYKAYANQQDKIEKYWCLRWVAQNMSDGIYETEAIVIRETTIRLAEIPLYLNAQISEDTPRQTRVRVQLQGIDWVGLTVGVRVMSVLGVVDELVEDEADEVMDEVTDEVTDEVADEGGVQETHEVHEVVASIDPPHVSPS